MFTFTSAISHTIIHVQARRSLFKHLLIVVCTIFLLEACQRDENSNKWDPSLHTEAVNQLKNICDNNEEVCRLLKKAISQAAEINPDRKYNPAQTLEEFYDFIDWNVRALPWNVMTGVKADKASLYSRVDQGVGYFWFIVGQPLDELKDRGYYYPTVEFVEPFSQWLDVYSDTWGDWLSTTDSWNDDYFQMVSADLDWGFTQGWYSTTNIYHSFNDFFSRHLASPSVRPIGTAEVVSCNDGWPKQLWSIDDNNQVVHSETLEMKTAKLSSVSDLIGEGSAYQDAFAGGTLTHSFLDVNDYHRYHCPVNGTIRELRKIPGVDAGGGYTLWDNELKLYYYVNELGFQMVETRACAIIETEDFGLVAMIPVGMSQICSVNWAEGLHVGQQVRKGDEIGYFLFGGSDIILLFQKDIEVTEIPKPQSDGSFDHILMGEDFLHLSYKKSLH